MLSLDRDVFRCLNSHEVRYLIIGGIAVVTHGVPRATFDLDIVIWADSRNAGRLLEALLDAGLGTAALTDVETLLANEITIFRDRVRIDVQTRTPGLDFEDAWSRRVLVSMGDFAGPVLSKADLIHAKLASGHPVDIEDVRCLQAYPQAEHKT